ncbi:MAG: DUF6049 family protein [Actinomycetota bacterium]|nr:DUF6049 family protein [Actinomycetota bacterium]
MTGRRWPRAGALAGALALLGASTAFTAFTPQLARAQPLNATSVTVSVADVRPTTPAATSATGQLVVVLDLHNNTDQTLPLVRVDGVRGNPIGSRSALDAAIAHPQPPSPNLAGTYTAQSPVTVALGPRATSEVSFTATTSTDSQSGAGLCICANQIYPLYFTAHVNDSSGADVVVGAGQTVVPAFGKSPPKQVRVSWVWPIIDRPHRLVGDTTFRDDELAYSISGGRLDRVLQVVESVAANRVAMTLVLDPELIDELAVMASGKYTVVANGKSTPGTGSDSAASWLSRLRNVLTRDPNLELDFTPVADPDVESLTRHGLSWTTGLAPAAQTRISAALGGHPVSTSLAWPAEGQLSTDTLNILARDGVTSVIVTESTLPSAAGVDASTDQLATLQTPAGPVTADVTQHSIQSYVAPVLSLGGQGKMLLPEFVSAVAVDAVASADAASFVTIVAPRNIDPAPDVAVRAITETATTAWSTPLTLAEAAHSIPPSDHGQLVPPPPATPQLSALTIESAQKVSALVPALATMLAPRDASRKLGELPAAVQRAESTAWRTDPAAGDAFATDLLKQVEAVQSSVRIVRPSTGTYTLASSNSPLPITIENKLDVPVTVRIQVSSVNDQPGFAAKIVLKTIAPSTTVTLRVPTQVDRAGRFRVQAGLLTPSGFAIDQVILSIHSTALGKIGLIITVVAAVILVLALLFRFGRRWRARPPRTTRSAPAR